MIPAGGAGLRMQAGAAGGGQRTRKQYLELDGEPVLLRALRPFLEHVRFESVVVALPPEDVADPPVEFPAGVMVVEGGEERSDSVRRALEAVPETAEVVLIHDAARPLVTPEVIDRVLRAVTPEQGAIAALPVADTLKRVRGEPEDGRSEQRGRRGSGGRGEIAETVDRSGLWWAQTPQGFPRRMILEAHRRAAGEGARATDDAALVERYGGRVVVVEGDPRNLKVTRPEDLELALLLLRTATR